MTKWLLGLCLIVGAMNAHADEIIERTLTGTSKNANATDARKEIQDDLTEQVTEELAKQILGEEKAGRNQATIKTRVVRSAGRYIPFQKPGQLQPSAEGFSMNVTWKINTTAFRQVLQQNGLLTENESAPVLLPLVAVIDREQNRSERWWMNDDAAANPALRNLSRPLELSLHNVFAKSGFYMIQPSRNGLAPGVPKILKNEKPSAEDLQGFSEWFGAPLVIEGVIQLSRSDSNRNGHRIEARLSVVQVSNGRPIGDVSRVYETESGPLEGAVEKKLREVSDALASDLASQVTEAWQKGSLGSSQIRLAVQQRLSFPEIEQFKEKLKASSVGVRSIRERVVSASGVTFEVDSPVASADLANRLKGFDFNGRRAEATAAGDGEVRLSFAGGAGR